MRSSAKNMCSVRHKPTPSAPNRRAISASSGVSALHRTPKRRYLSAQAISSAKSPPRSASTSGACPRMTCPEAPSMVIKSPARTSTPPIRQYPELSLMTNSRQPTTQLLPIPRATTAAWLVIPPRAVRIPCAACIPRMSSGDVSVRTNNTRSPASCRRTASSAVNTTRPLAAPGDAGNPLANTVSSAIGSIIGCSNWSICSGATRMTASRSSKSPSCTMSTAMRTAAGAVRFAERVCSRYKRPF